MLLLWLSLATPAYAVEGWSRRPATTDTFTFGYSAKTIDYPATSFVFPDTTIQVPGITTVIPATTITTTSITTFVDISNDIADLNVVVQTYYPNVKVATITSYADIRANADLISVQRSYTKTRPDILREFRDELDSILPDWYGQYFTALNPFQPPQSLSSALDVLKGIAPYPGVAEAASRYVEAWRTYSAELAVEEASILASDLSITPDAPWLAYATQAAKAIPADSAATTTSSGQTKTTSTVPSSNQPSSGTRSGIDRWIMILTTMTVILCFC